jgi:hypothetical protein
MSHIYSIKTDLCSYVEYILTIDTTDLFKAVWRFGARRAQFFIT